MKILFEVLALIIVILISGCSKDLNENTKDYFDEQLQENINENISNIENNAKKAIVQEDPKLNSLLKNLKNSTVNYKINYERENEYYLWGGGAGSSSSNEKSEIFVEAINNEIINYTVKYLLMEKGYKTKDYYKYFDKSQNKMCQYEVITKSDCYAATFSPPKLGGILSGCKIDYKGILNGKSGTPRCLCKNGNLEPNVEEGFPCKENKNTDNMEIKYLHALYKKELKKGLCYYSAKDIATGKSWIFECPSQDFELTPLIKNKKELKNLECYRYGYTSCSCTFDPLKISSCKWENPINSDSFIKTEILGHLESIDIEAISEMDNKYGHCYSFFGKGLEHTFCFDSENLITFAKWGENLSIEGDIHVQGYKRKDINTIKKIF